ncbi:MAG: hypothetical protein A2784_04550 [Candidatus Chisholmbacteria bacterium RIFCSPHIGHO2_01_FULL_48_12]|uniref:Glycosyltransferase RgtA/B/C/D-like domain-containing protein n=1 Tax=Candidatus Chisholmbacteria bacterium RIFCSPHIGHO2_01_FULL_48_12 TaxID=1797589 RepID=A0A1G1VNC6_9BACT|nr:MAG: hypothetical protein A2784_04550 [Candidatus Chisholmbacteria bacterium RIFCSPHIGHO2_01_FULL_48_12]
MLIIIVLTFISLILRLINLGDFPANISVGELGFIYPLRHLINYNLFIARLPFVLLYTATILLVVILVRRLSRPIAIWTGILLTVSPWHLGLSRRAVPLWFPWLNLELTKFLERFFDFLSPVNLFFANSLLSVTLPLLLIGLARAKKFDRLFWLSVKLIIAGTGLASLQVYFGNHDALVLALFGWTILLGWGITHSLHRFPWLVFIFTSIFIYQIINSLHNYFIHLQAQARSQWEMIYQPVSRFILDHQDEYQRIVVIPKYGYPREYLDWYSKGQIDQSKLVIDQFKDDYLNPNTVYIGHINEQIKHQVLATFELPTGSVLLFAGTGTAQAK